MSVVDEDVVDVVLEDGGFAERRRGLAAVDWGVDVDCRALTIL